MVAEQPAGIGGAIESMAAIARSGHIRQRRKPLSAVIGRLDQRVSKIAKLALVIGQLEARRRGFRSSDGRRADPTMDAVGNQKRVHLPEITVGGAAEQ